MPRRKRDLTIKKDPVQPLFTDRPDNPSVNEENWLTRLVGVLAIFERMSETEQLQALRFIKTKYPML